MKVTAILLAAGRSTRFLGGDKLLADFGGRPVIAWSADAMLESKANALIIVTGQDHLTRRDAVSGLNVTHAIAVAGEKAASLAAGVAALDPDCDGAIVMPADMPLVTTGDIDRLLESFTQSGGRAIVHASTPAGQRPPVVYPRKVFPELLVLKGKESGKTVIARHPGQAHGIMFDLIAAQRFEDIDTTADLDRLALRITRSGPRPA